MSRRSTAVALIAAAGLAPVAALALGWDWYLDGPPSVLLAVAGGYAAGAWLPRRVAALATLAACACLVAVNQAHGVAFHWLDDTVFFLVVVGGPAAAGVAATERARQVRRLERLQADLDEQQRVEVAAARLDEQTRVQHEVHTRLAERIAGIAVRAQGAQRTRDLSALPDIETEARGVLDQLRETVGSMRTTEPAGGGTEAPPGPAPGRPPRDPAARPTPSIADVAVALGVGGALAVETTLVSHARGPAWANVVAALVVVAPLVLRRGRPVLAAAATMTLGCAMSAWLTPIPTTVTGVALLVLVFYSVGAWARGRWWVAGWAVAAAGSVAMEAVTRRTTTAGEGDDTWIVLVWTLGAVALGRVGAGWQERLRRTQAVVEELEHGRRAAVHLAQARERETLAAQLHDTVAHAMTAVCLQAGAARRTPDGTDDVLTTIGSVAETSLDELRDGLDAFESVDEPLEPGRIVAVGRRLGVPVEVSGDAVAGPAALLGFRVVREAVVNVARHAPGATARVRFHRPGKVLSLEVTDCGSPHPGSVRGTGHGLAGLAAAVADAGGRLEWGPRPEGGFRVTATIPQEQP